MYSVQKEISRRNPEVPPDRGEPPHVPAEGHTVRRWCGHDEVLHVWKPWTYIDGVAALVACADCRRSGTRGPLDFVRGQHETMSSGVVTPE